MTKLAQCAGWPRIGSWHGGSWHIGAWHVGLPRAALSFIAAALLLSAPLRVAAAPIEPGADQVMLAWLDAHGRVQRIVLGRDGQPYSPAQRGRIQERVPFPERIPIGSLWKLAVYGRLVESARNEPAYHCAGGDPEEVYCCAQGVSIDRGTALWRSCGRYFSPQRLNWARWQGRANGDGLLDAAPSSIAALRDPAALQGGTRVELAQWLQWLADWPSDLRTQAASDLLPYWLQGPGQAVLGAVGSRLRVKTFTVEREGAPAERWSGASGWLDGGMPIWFAARGSSAHSVPRWAPVVLAWLDAQGGSRDARVSAGAAVGPGHPGGCVEVRFFARYPLRSIEPDPLGGTPDQRTSASDQRTSASDQRTSALGGHRYRLVFDNGRTLSIDSRNDLFWRQEEGRPVIRGRFALDDYVARVIEREGSGEPVAAARALAVAARTYLLAHADAGPSNACLRIDDSSATQRVAPRPASPAARRAAADTAGLVLAGATGNYHAVHADVGVMSWADAREQAERGRRFDQILARAYPRAALASLGAARNGAVASSCEPNPSAAQWLSRQRPGWRRMLQAEPGYRDPSSIQVCRLDRGRPHALAESNRIYAHGARSLQERLALAHEYLHLAFAGHPRANDERFIEQRARSLLGVDDPGEPH